MTNLPDRVRLLPTVSAPTRLRLPSCCGNTRDMRRACTCAVLDCGCRPGSWRARGRGHPLCQGRVGHAV